MKIVEKIPEQAARYERPNIEAIETFMQSHVAGQSEAVKRVSQELVQVLSGLQLSQNGPRGSLLMLGPSGVGKTETAITAMEYLLSHSKLPVDQRDAKKLLLKINCGEYTQQHHVSTIMGAPPGYVGSKGAENAGKGNYVPPALGNEALTQHSFELEDGQTVSVVLLDEIEKAHQSIRDFLLSALDKGTARNAVNDEIDFRNTLFFFTSNLGNQQLARIRAEGSNPGPEETARVRRAALMSTFRPEDVSRMSGSAQESIIFQPIDRATSEKILGIQLESVERQFLENGIILEFQLTQAAKDELLNRGVDPDTGARALKTVLKRSIYQPLLHPSKQTNFKTLGNKTIFIDFETGATEFSFYTEKTETSSQKEQPQLATEKPKPVEQDRPLIETVISPEASSKLKELNVEFNPNNLEFTFLNFGIVHPINFRWFVNENKYRKMEFLKTNSVYDVVAVRLTGSDTNGNIDFFIDKNGLPSQVSFVVNQIKQSGRPNYSWRGVFITKR